MSDVVWKVYNTQDVDNGGARVEAPKGLGHLAVSGAGSANYEIDTYSTKHFLTNYLQSSF